jgi:hypothetical protein
MDSWDAFLIFLIIYFTLVTLNILLIIWYFRYEIRDSLNYYFNFSQLNDTIALNEEIETV